MGDLLKLIWYAVAGLFRSRAALQTEVLALRYQLNVLRRGAPKRVTVSNIDRLVFAGLYHLAPEVLDAVKILRPETIIRWHRAGFRTWWRWKSRPRGGRPRTSDEIRQLVREMSVANPHGALPASTVNSLSSAWMLARPAAKYMAKRRRPPSRGWRTFVRNHADAIASIDMFVVPTISFGLLYGLLILRQSRRELLWLGVTAHPNAEWLARQLTEACGWDKPPRYLIRDRDGAYGAASIRRIRSMGIRDRPVATGMS